MTPTRFQPGFRCSITDVIVLALGLVGTLVLGFQTWWTGFVVAFVVLHFFLFCNVFRISRGPELIWAGVFLLLTSGTILWEMPGWPAVIVACVGLSSFLIWRETRHPSYHGIGWQRWNPGLREWYDARTIPPTTTP